MTEALFFWSIAFAEFTRDFLSSSSRGSVATTTTTTTFSPARARIWSRTIPGRGSHVSHNYTRPRPARPHGGAIPLLPGESANTYTMLLTRGSPRYCERARTPRSSRSLGRVRAHPTASPLVPRFTHFKLAPFLTRYYIRAYFSAHVSNRG